MSKAFKKGELVTYVASWDNKGTFYFVQAIVHSCGAKQMVLTSEETGEEMGRHYSPKAGDVETLHMGNWGATFKRMTDAEAEALCLELAAKVPSMWKAENERRRTHNENIGRTVLCLYDLNEVHEPRAIKRSK